MRHLAIARFRLLTIIRQATPIYVIVALPLLVVMVIESPPELFFRASADQLLGVNATAALIGWILHGLMLFVVCLSSGMVRLPHDGPVIVVVPDLMDTAPVGPDVRFWGEALGTLGATSIIHACCLPLLGAVAALSPLPTSMFLWIEAGTIVLMILASTGAAWQRRAQRTRYSFTRGARNASVIAILFLLILLATTRWEAFRDSSWAFVSGPSMKAWAAVTLAVENPFLMFVLFSLLYAGTITYYYMTSVWNRTRG